MRVCNGSSLNNPHSLTFGFYPNPPTVHFFSPSFYTAMAERVQSAGVAQANTLTIELKAIFDDNGVPDRFREFLLKYNVTTVQKFASAAATEELVEKKLIQASGINDLDFGEEVAITSSWNAARAQMNGGTIATAGPAASKPASKMPEGVEIQLRAR